MFSLPELAAAVTMFCRRTGVPLPPGTVTECRIESSVSEGSEVVGFCMTLDPDPTEGEARKAREVRTGGSNLAAALILYCRDHRIPLPSDADKSLRRFGEHVALVVTRNPRGKSVPKIEPG